MSVAALILAAGRGTRFAGGPKLLAPLDGKPLVRHVADAALASGARPVIAVLGHEREPVAAALPEEVVLLVNPDYADGLSTSLKAGFAALPAGAEGAVILLGDMPRIGPSLIDGLVRAWTEAGRPAALVPTYRGRRGNPVLLSRALAPGIAALAGDRGAGALLAARPDAIEWPSEDPAVAWDVDTREALERIEATPPPS